MSSASDLAEGREMRKREGAARIRRSRHRVAIAAGVVAVLAAIAPFIGAWNPGNFVVVDRLFDHPTLGGCIAVAALVVVWHETVMRERLRPVGFVVLTLAGLAWLALGILVKISLAESRETSVADNPANDVQLRITDAKYDFGKQIWHVSLYASRGITSRENHVAVLDVVEDDAPGILPSIVTARFTGADEVEVLVEDQVAYRLRFDPGDLSVRSERCTPVPAGGGYNLTIGCSSDFTEWEI
ncbi:MAG TPA: hypothetical protein VGJ86_03575 [Acidimicrobiales bacterium]|jgi:hypothetical protein